jgi:hypothetical protein
MLNNNNKKNNNKWSNDKTHNTDHSHDAVVLGIILLLS